MRAIILSILFFTSCTLGQDEDFDPPPPKPVGVVESAKSTLKARVYYQETGRPVKRTSVMLVTLGRGEREANGVTDGNGNLEIKNLRAGKYYAIVNAPGVASPMAYLVTREGGSEEVANQLAGFPAIVIDGMTDTIAEIPARRGGAIGGRVTYADGDPAIGVRVEILRKNENDEFAASIPNMSAVATMMTGGAGSFMTDDRGVYRFAGLPAGEYIVKVTENVVHARGERPSAGYGGFESMLFGNQSSMLSVFFDNVFEKEKAQKLELQFGQELGEINLIIPDRGLYTLEGKVVAAKDKLPVRGARVSVKREGEADTPNAYLRTLEGVYTDGEGRFLFGELPKGKYVVSVESIDAVLDEKDRAYGKIRSAENAAQAADAVMAVANAMATAANGSIRSGSVRVPERPAKFSNEHKQITIEEADLMDQSIELKFGATISGTVVVEGTKESPENVIVSASNEQKLVATASAYFYDAGMDGTPKGELKRDFRLEAIPAGENHFNISIMDKSFYVKSASSSQIDLLKGGMIKVKEGDLFANVKIVVSNDTGTLKGTLIDGDKQPVGGVDLYLVPTDSAKMNVTAHYRFVRTDEKGEFQVKLPPFEYAILAVPKKSSGKKADETTFADLVKRAQTVKIEAGKTATVQFSSEKMK